MSPSLNGAVELWEGEGGASAAPLGARAAATNVPTPVEWAERIKCRVKDEFDQVVRALSSDQKE